MRPTTRLFATAARGARILEPHTPTGLTGLLTHPTPRATLIHLYSVSLSQLSSLPASSVYRQATEALTTQRLKIVESVVPAGWEAWKAETTRFLQEHPEIVGRKGGVKGDADGVRHVTESVGSRGFLHTTVNGEGDDVVEGGEATLEGPRSSEERRGQASLGAERHASVAGKEGEIKIVNWERLSEVFPGREPPLDVDQISDIETRIGAGLIEEVIQVAEGELKLIKELAKSKVWEDLEEKPVEGQWTYFSRAAAKN